MKVAVQSSAVPIRIKSQHLLIAGVCDIEMTVEKSYLMTVVIELIDQNFRAGNGAILKGVAHNASRISFHRRFLCGNSLEAINKGVVLSHDEDVTVRDLHPMGVSDRGRSHG